MPTEAYAQSYLIFLRKAIAVLKRGEVCPIPYVLCPSALCQIVPHVTEKGYNALKTNLIAVVQGDII
jgi:hypothetical protein